MSFLQISGVDKAFGKHAVLNDVSLTIQRGEFLCLLGPSGCGKTTLLRIIAGLESADAGTVFMDGRDITYLSPGERRFGMVFQSYALFPNLTVSDNILFGLRGYEKNRRILRDKLDAMLELTGLRTEAHKHPAQLSGGQQQRVALARALIMDPQVLLLDEPLSALDAKIRRRLAEELKTVQRQIGVTAIMVTHDREEAFTLADTVAVMNRGRIEQSGAPEMLYRHPETHFTAHFLGHANTLEESGDGCVMIRPEHLRLSQPTGTEGRPAEVQSLNFCGAFYRMELMLLEERRSLVAEVPAAEMVELDLTTSRRVCVNLPEARQFRCRK